MQLYAARIVTGLPILASNESLYFETGWEPLCERSRTAKLTTMYRMHINTVLQYLCDTIANFRKNAQYNTQNEEKFLEPIVDLIFKKITFSLDAIRKWNALPNDVIKSSTLGQFRRSISNFSKDSSALMYFNFGKRLFNIIHIKLRHNCILILICTKKYHVYT